MVFYKFKDLLTKLRSLDYEQIAAFYSENNI